jgi:hypothetical protein
MQRKVTRAVVPLAAAVAATTAGTCAWSQDGPHTHRQGAASRCAEGPVTGPRVPAPAPAPGLFGDGLGLAPSPGPRAAPPLLLALTAHPQGAAADVVRYRVKARSMQGDLRGITVTARLTCAPGEVRFVGRPSLTTGHASTERRTLTWRLDLSRASATATFAVRVRPGDEGGLLVGELTATGPASNCPAVREADEPADPFCRAAVAVPPHPAQVGHPVTPAPAVPPSTHPSGTPGTPSTPGTSGTSGTPGTLGVTPSAQAMSVPAAGAPAGAPAGPAAMPPLPASTPSPNLVLSQVDRAPLVPADSGDSAAGAPQDAPEVAPQDMAARSVLRSASYAQDDLSGRAFAFLLGGVAFLLIAAVVAGRLVGLSLRRRGPRTVSDK